MAEVVAISLQVDSGQSVKEVKKLEDAIKDVQKTTNSSNVEEKFNSLNQAIDRGEGSVEDLRKAIKSYQTIALSAGRTSPIGQEALKRSADLKDKLTDLDNEVKRLAQDGKNLQGALQIGQSAVAGYQAMTSITALLGVENEELMKTMVKLQASMSLLQAIEQIRLATEKESQAMLFIKNAQTKIAIGLQKAYALAVGTGTKALKGLRTALLATGVGAIIVALGTIVAYWDDIKGAVSGLSKEQKKRNKDLEKEKELTQSNLDNISKTENTLRLAGKSEQEILDMKLAQLDIQLDQQRQTIENAKLQKKTQVEASERNNKIAQNTIRILSLPITMLLGAIDLLTYGLEQVGILEEATNLEESFSGGIASMLFDPEEVASESDKTIEEAEKGLAELQNTRDGYTLKEQEKSRANYEKSKAVKQKQFEEELQMLRDKMQKELDLEEEMQDLIIENMQDEDAKKLAQLQLQHDRELSALRDKYGMETELEIELLKKQARELNEAKKEIAKQTEEELRKAREEEDPFADEEREIELEKFENYQLSELEILKARFDAGLISEKEYNDGVAKLEQEKEDIRKAGFATASSIFNSLGALMEGNEQAQKGVIAVQKALTLAQIGIDTAKAISSLTAMSAGNPANAVTGGVAGAIQYASGLAQILSNIAQAKQLLSGSGSAVTPPTINRPSNNSNLTTTTSGTAPVGNDTTGFNSTNRVVLVESELQAMQSRRQQVERIATI